MKNVWVEIIIYSREDESDVLEGLWSPFGFICSSKLDTAVFILILIVLASAFQPEDLRKKLSLKTIFPSMSFGFRVNWFFLS